MHAVVFGSLDGADGHCKLIQECLKMNVPLIIKSVHLCSRSTLYRVWQTNLHCTTYESTQFCYAISGSRTVTVAEPYSASLLYIRFVYLHTKNWPSICLSSCILQCKGAGAFMIKLHISVVIRH